MENFNPNHHHNGHLHHHDDTRGDWWTVIGSMFIFGLIGYFILLIFRSITFLFVRRLLPRYSIFRIHPLSTIFCAFWISFLGWFFWLHDHPPCIVGSPTNTFVVHNGTVETRWPPEPKNDEKMIAQWRSKWSAPPISVVGTRDGVNRVFHLQSEDSDFGKYGENIIFGEQGYRWYNPIYNPIHWVIWLMVLYSMFDTVWAVLRE